MRYLWLPVLVVMLSGCTTMKMLDDAGKQADKGNYGMATFMGATSLFAGPIIDIFTLGGALDTPEKARAATDTATTALAAGQPSASSQQIAQVNRELREQQARQQITTQAQAPGQTPSNRAGINSISEDPVVQKTAVQNTAAAQGKLPNNHAPFLSSSCVHFSNWGSGVSADVKKISNRCHRPIAVRFCFYDDRQKNRCDNEDIAWGVSNSIAVGAEVRAVNPLNEVPGLFWRVKYRVCDMSDASKMCLKPQAKSNVAKIGGGVSSASLETNNSGTEQYKRSGYEYADTSVKPIVTPSLPASYGRPRGSEGVRRPGMR